MLGKHLLTFTIIFTPILLFDSAVIMQNITYAVLFVSLIFIISVIITPESFRGLLFYISFNALMFPGLVRLFMPIFTPYSSPTTYYAISIILGTIIITYALQSDKSVYMTLFAKNLPSMIRRDTIYIAYRPIPLKIVDGVIFIGNKKILATQTNYYTIRKNPHTYVML